MSLAQDEEEQEVLVPFNFVINQDRLPGFRECEEQSRFDGLRCALRAGACTAVALSGAGLVVRFLGGGLCLDTVEECISNATDEFTECVAPLVRGIEERLEEERRRLEEFGLPPNLCDLIDFGQDVDEFDRWLAESEGLCLPFERP